MGSKTYEDDGGKPSHGNDANKRVSNHSAYLSSGVEALFAKIGHGEHSTQQHLYDFLIVGSGYGGAIAAEHLTKTKKGATPLRVCLLERGREFLPGAFPNSIEEAPTEIRFTAPNGTAPGGNCEGLFDLRLGNDLNVVQANGLGGGSLINAGVMERPKAEIFDPKRWGNISALWDKLEDHYANVEKRLGVTIDGQENTINSHAGVSEDKPLKKFASIKALQKDTSSASFKAARLSISMAAGENDAGQQLNACRLCGNCATGCNFGAKNSLDENLLVTAKRQGAEIYTGATVLKFERVEAEKGKDNGYWLVDVVYTDKTLRSRQPVLSYQVKTKNLILSAGTLGSTELLLKSQSKTLQFSECLGSKFSSNGDMILVGYGQNQEANAIAKHTVPEQGQEIGPTITGILECDPIRLKVEQASNPRGNTASPPMVFQEMAVPVSLGHFFTELYTSTLAIRDLGEPDLTRHHRGQLDPAQVNKTQMQRTSLYAAMGDDLAAGQLALAGNADTHMEGTLQVRWKSLRNSSLLYKQEQTLIDLSKSSGVGGDVIQNPAWKLMPDKLMFLLNNRKGPPLTVHPLGGCGMGEDARCGVTNEFGRVFNTTDRQASSDIYPGLQILDGSIIPCSLAINPALTIAAVARRAIEHTKQQYVEQLQARKLPAGSAQIRADQKASEAWFKHNNRRPFLRDSSLAEPPGDDTEIEITERLVGQTSLPSDTGEIRDVVVELTLWTKSKRVKDLIEQAPEQSNDGAKAHQFELRSNNCDPITGAPRNLLRIYYLEDWLRLRDQDPIIEMGESKLSETAKFEARISGWLSVLECEPSNVATRFFRSTIAWYKNRGLRDAYQTLFPAKWEKSSEASLGAHTLAAFTRAGAVRTLKYQIKGEQELKTFDFGQLGFVIESTKTDADLNSENSNYYNIVGKKHLCYRRESNPWRQLSEVTFTKFPGKGNAIVDAADSIRTSSSVTDVLRGLSPICKQAIRDNKTILATLMAICITVFMASFALTHSSAVDNGIINSIAVNLIWPTKEALLFIASMLLVIAPIGLLLVVVVKYQSKRHKDKDNSKARKLRLALDTNYLVKVGIPLINITKQKNQVQALADISSLVAYFARIIFGIHFYSFRLPDTSPPRRIDRRPHQVPGLANAKLHKINVAIIPKNKVDGLNAGSPVHIELTEYSSPSNTRRPILLIHGYSTSSTSFAHSSLPNSMARHFFEGGRDVWLLDMRTSSALASARYPWKFEEAAEVDIPTAIDYVHQRYQGGKIDILAHCMGASMLGMAILQDNKDKFEHDKAAYLHWQEQFATADFYAKRVNRIAFSQGTPTARFTPANNFRAFVTSYLKELIPDDYQFFPDSKSQLDTQFLDRVLYTLPYHDTEYLLTNPRGFRNRRKRAAFVRTRHRMDALYGQTFEASNLNPETLKHIDDIFGPLHVDTVVQAGHFASKGVITNHQGENVYVSKRKLKERWLGIPTFSLHSKYNGLLDYSTGKRTQRIFSEAGVDYLTCLIDEGRYGHQDSLLADNAHTDIFRHYSRFFDTHTDNQKVTPESDNEEECGDISLPTEPGNLMLQKTQTWIVEPPCYGPVIVGKEEVSERCSHKILFGLNNSRAAEPKFYALIPVIEYKDGFSIRLEGGQTLADYIRTSFALSPQPVEVDGDQSWLSIDIDDQALSKLIAPTKLQSNEGNPNKKSGLLLLVCYQDLATITDDVITIEQELDFSISNKAEVNATRQANAEAFSTSCDENKLCTGIAEKVVASFFQSKFNQRPILEQGLIEALSKLHHTSATESAEEHGSRLCFAVGSCQYPAGIFDSTIAHNSYKQLGEYLSPTLPGLKPSFVTLLGDQIYADATAGLLDPTDKFNRFTAQYLNLYANKDVRKVLRQLPMYAMLDDHEIHDNFEPSSMPTDLIPDEQLEKQEELGLEGKRSFLKFQRGQHYQLQPGQKSNFWYSFEQQGHNFFMLDTRTQRSARNCHNILHPETNIIGEQQLDALQQWLKSAQEKTQNQPKFILSGSVLLPRHRHTHGDSGNTYANAIRSDGWDGYPVSLHRILAFIETAQIQNVVFLSGDEHINCYAKIDLQIADKSRPAVSIRSIHCSGLYTPFPFANSRKEMLMGGADHFSFENQGEESIHCNIETCFGFSDLGFDPDRPIEVNSCSALLGDEKPRTDGNGFAIISLRETSKH